MSAASWLSSRVTVRRASGREADGAARLEDTSKPKLSRETQSRLLMISVANSTAGKGEMR